MAGFAVQRNAYHFAPCLPGIADGLQAGGSTGGAAREAVDRAGEICSGGGEIDDGHYPARHECAGAVLEEDSAGRHRF